MEIKQIVKNLSETFEGGFSATYYKPEENIDFLLTDSRNCFHPEGTMFFAIQTPGGNDGHKFVPELYHRGIRNFVVEYIPDEMKDIRDVNVIIVPDTVEALMEVGKMHRNRAKEVVAITGSSGKTTLKEMIFQLMSPYKNISRSPRSFNSRIGVPLSLWQIAPDSDLALIEAGISQRGEMRKLAETIEPDTVILTNIGPAHSNGFSSQDEKAAEKILIAFPKSVKTIIYNRDCRLLEKKIQDIKHGKEIIGWSLKDKESKLYLSLKDCKEGEKILEYVWENQPHELKISLSRDYEIENVAGALAFMLKEGVPHETIRKRIESLQKINTRLKVSEGINNCSVILDSYTSDFSSLLPAIDFARRRKSRDQKLTLIISDLQHEGEDLETAYKGVAKIIEEAGVDNFIGIGDNISSFSDFFPSFSSFYKSTEQFLKEWAPSKFTDELILIKGVPAYGFDRIYEQLEARKHETVLEVNLDAMLRNYNYFRSKVPSSTGMIAMVKASGYGAGSHEIAKTLQDAGASYLAVAVLDEGIDLRNSGVTMPIMVMNPRVADYRALFGKRLEPVVYTKSILLKLIEEAHRNNVKEYPVHIKLDTGMHRMGFNEKDIEELAELLNKSDNVRVATIFSHLATADCLDMDEFTLRQIHLFESMSDSLISKLGYPVKRHILNSAGILRFPQYAYDLVRLGIGLYGANTLPDAIEKPLSVVSTLRTVIICIREIEGEEAVGYGRRGVISGKTKVATLPLGYADGINRKFGNGAMQVIVNDKLVPTIGNICMDAMMIDVTGIDCREGDFVEIFGDNVPLQQLADTLDTIPYEILTSVSPRVKRLYYRE